jgi:hypothetical protein
MSIHDSIHEKNIYILLLLFRSYSDPVCIQRRRTSIVYLGHVSLVYYLEIYKISCHNSNQTLDHHDS